MKLFGSILRKRLAGWTTEAAAIDHEANDVLLRAANRRLDDHEKRLGLLESELESISGGTQGYQGPERRNDPKRVVQ